LLLLFDLGSRSGDSTAALMGKSRRQRSPPFRHRRLCATERGHWRSTVLGWDQEVYGSGEVIFLARWLQSGSSLVAL